jgi:hypothetical protein
MRPFTTLVAILFLAASPAFAQKAKAHKSTDLLGTWTHDSGAGKVTLVFKEHTLSCTISDPENVTVRVDAEYMITRDGFLLGMLHGKKQKGESAYDEANRRFICCKVTKDGDALIVRAFISKGGREELAKIVEGNYKKRGSPEAKAAYSSDPNVRMTQLLNESEDFRRVEQEWARWWLEDEAAKKKQARAEKK